jgi:hypothetical protein
MKIETTMKFHFTLMRMNNNGNNDNKRNVSNVGEDVNE